MLPEHRYDQRCLDAENADKFVCLHELDDFGDD